VTEEIAEALATELLNVFVAVLRILEAELSRPGWDRGFRSRPPC